MLNLVINADYPSDYYGYERHLGENITFKVKNGSTKLKLSIFSKLTTKTLEWEQKASFSSLCR